MNRTNDILTAFLTGVATGAVLGVLYAPDSGKNTREKLRLQLNKYAGQLRLLVNRKKEEIQSGTYPTSYKEQEDYKKAEELLFEVESILDELKQKSQS